jgi:4-amino-4-deoxy-L-arabinose transferase-like glycosyltransferase
MKTAPGKEGKFIPGDVLLVLVLGLAIRIYTCQNTSVVNLDGIGYIYQAKGVYQGRWNVLGDCGVYFLSSYPFFIAGVYTLLHDWITAARLVSCLFGFAMLIPLYVLIRSFFDEKTSLLTLLILALTPPFVEGSADLVRDPPFWFFLALGLLLFVKQMDEDRPLYLILSSVSFLLAAWARMDAILIIILSALYILLGRREQRYARFFSFLLPIVLAGFFIVCGASLLGLDVGRSFRMHEIMTRMSMPLDRIKHIHAVLSHLLTQYPPQDVMNSFLEETRNGIWLVATGTLLNQIGEGFFYPFLLVTLTGLAGIGKEIKKDRRVFYLFLLTVSLLGLLYLQTLFLWRLTRRYVAMVVIPCSICTGLGTRRILAFFEHKFGLRESAALALLVFLILGFGVPRNLMVREHDKLVFKEIGLFISGREGAGREVRVATSYLSPQWVPFYANSLYEGLHCGKRHAYGPDVIRRGTRGLLLHLKRHGARYFLWEQNYWPKDAFDPADTPQDVKLEELGRWYHQDTGLMVLYELREVTLLGGCPRILD